MDLPISGTHLAPWFLIGVGFTIGVLGGFFGVGGSFLTGPLLFAAGLPMNFVVGTDLAHIVGKSIVAAKKHRALGNVDLKLGTVMVLGTIAGVETGAQIIQSLKRHANLDLVVGLGFILVLVSISAFVGWESWQTLQRRRRRGPPDPAADPAGRVKEDESVLSHLHRRIHSLRLPPMIHLPNSGLERVSVWTILAVAFVGGVFSGFLGGGAGYIRLPAMVYLLGVPTHVAVGTDLFEVVISASYGTLTHAIKGNVDIVIALVMNLGAVVGAQVGVALTEYFHGTRIRLAFAPLPLLGAALVAYSLVTGHHLK